MQAERARLEMQQDYWLIRLTCAHERLFALQQLKIRAF